MVGVKVLNFFFTVSCFVGLALSIYAYIVELAAEKDASFKASCDINDYVSCTTVLRSEYATGFGIVSKLLGKDSPLNIPNSLFGIPFYSLLIIFAQVNGKTFAILNLFFSAISVWLSIYLAYLLVFVIRSVCVLCVGVYVVNIVNFICSYYKYKSLTAIQPAAVKSKKKRA